MPKVSVIIPTYNTAKYICEAIDSVLAQTYQDLEIIVIDDGSTDDTAKILGKYGDKIKYIHQENKGVSVARNRGIHEAQGEYVAFLDADDTWLPDKIKVQIAVAEANPEVDLILTDVKFFDDNQDLNGTCKPNNKNDYEEDSLRYKLASKPHNDGSIIKGNFYKDLIMGCLSSLSTSFMRKKCLIEVGYFDRNLKIGEDYDLWLRISLSHTLLFFNTVTTCYRIRNDSSSGTVNLRPYFYRSHDTKVLEKQLLMSPLPYKKLIKKRILECYRTTIWAYYNLNDLKKARSLCLRSLRHNIFQIKLYYYLFASFFPAGLIKPRTPLKLNE